MKLPAFRLSCGRAEKLRHTVVVEHPQQHGGGITSASSVKARLGHEPHHAFFPPPFRHLLIHPLIIT